MNGMRLIMGCIAAAVLPLTAAMPVFADEPYGQYQGQPYASSQNFYPQEADPALIALGVGIGILIALLICMKFRSDMKTARKRTDANMYLKAESISFSLREDSYTHTTESRTPISGNKN